MCPMCLVSFAATVVGLASASGGMAVVATKRRSGVRPQDAPKTNRFPVEREADLKPPAGEPR